MAMHNPQLPNREALIANLDNMLLTAILKGRQRSEWRIGSIEWRRETATEIADAILALIPSPDQGEAEAYEIGKNEGYADAVQWIDARTGGDGEYRYCLGVGDDERHCPGPVEMREKIVARFNDLSTAPSLAEVRDAMADVMKLRRLSSTPEERETANKAIAVWDRLDKALATPPVDSAKPGELRPEVLAFAAMMEQQLRANDHKPGWKNACSADLLDRIADELAELDLANARHTKRLMWGDGWQMEDTVARVGREAADVANFALMIADVCGALSASLPEPQIGVEWRNISTFDGEPYEIYLITLDDGTVTPGYFAADGEDEEHGHEPSWYWIDASSEGPAVATHWQPLPAGPGSITPGDRWVTFSADKAHYLDDGVSRILCDRLPSPVTLVLKNPVRQDGVFVPVEGEGARP